MGSAARPVPRPQGADAEFYAHCAKGRLCFQRCLGCRTWRHLPRPMCPRCGSVDWEWNASSGRGRIYSWTVTHQPLHPAFAAETPYVVAVVELEEGVRMVSRLRDLPAERLVLDLPVEVSFERVSEEITLPCFRPLAA